MVRVIQSLMTVGDGCLRKPESNPGLLLAEY